MSTLIKQSVFFEASPHALYEALLDSAQHATFTKAQAEISREVDGSFMAYDGYITGFNLELLPDQKIVQRWRAIDWPENYFSVVTFVFTAQAGGTRIDFTHVDVPDGTEEEFGQGWIDNYWEPLQAFLKGV
jgi:activator of HSP90 ATPase